jgi:hypothetical protein
MNLPRRSLLLGVQASVALLLLGCSQAASTAQQSPAADPAINAYKTLMLSDDNKMGASTSNHCNTVQDTACPAAVARVVATLQQWLDDLNGFKTPARFATIDGQMKRHLTAVLSYLSMVVVANRAQDQNSEDRALQAATNERAWVDDITLSIAHSAPATAVIYLGSVRAEKAGLDGCDGCQRAVGQGQLSCDGSAQAGCDSLLRETSTQIETFEGALVLNAAPAGLSSKDARLQSDLAQCDTALIAMTGALLTGDQSGFNAARTLLQRGAAAVDGDVTTVLKS